MATTSRYVPTSCLVCLGTGKRHPYGFEVDCEPCAGKGWLYVTETTTTPDPVPGTVHYRPDPGHAVGWYCSGCGVWVTGNHICWKAA